MSWTLLIGLVLPLTLAVVVAHYWRGERRLLESAQRFEASKR